MHFGSVSHTDLNKLFVWRKMEAAKPGHCQAVNAAWHGQFSSQKVKSRNNFPLKALAVPWAAAPVVLLRFLKPSRIFFVELYKTSLVSSMN